MRIDFQRKIRYRSLDLERVLGGRRLLQFRYDFLVLLAELVQRNLAFAAILTHEFRPIGIESGVLRL